MLHLAGAGELRASSAGSLGSSDLELRLRWLGEVFLITVYDYVDSQDFTIQRMARAVSPALKQGDEAMKQVR